MRLNNEEMRAILDCYWEATVTQNLEKVHEFYHDDVVIEFPQSGERIRGKQTIYELRSHYPTKTSYGDSWITEVIVTYDNDKGNTIYGVAIMEFRNDKVAHEKHSILRIHSNHLNGD